jgi:beta-galactosidase/beta-glucuronidase
VSCRALPFFPQRGRGAPALCDPARAPPAARATHTPHARSIEFRLRLPGVDLWTTHKPAWYEVALQFMLLGAVYLHR